MLADLKRVDTDTAAQPDHVRDKWYESYGAPALSSRIPTCFSNVPVMLIKGHPLTKECRNERVSDVMPMPNVNAPVANM